MNEMKRFTVSADYHQFYLMDAQIQPSIPEAITEQDMARRLRTAPHIVVVHTETDSKVPVEVGFVDDQPKDMGSWALVSGFSLLLSSGELALCGCTEYVPGCPRIEASPGKYQGHAYFAAAASPGGGALPPAPLA